MGNNGKPKPLKIQEAEVIPSPVVSRPKPLDLSDANPPSSGVASPPTRMNIVEQAPIPKPARMSIPDTPAAPVPPPPRPKVASKTDILIDKAVSLEKTVQPHRIRGRIDTILSSSVTDLLDFGNRNLQPLQDASNKKARIASELSRIDSNGWIELAKDASCKPPSFMDRFTAKPPSYYEGMLKKCRAELLVFVAELEGMKNAFLREVTDLHLDAISMIVCSEEMADDHAKQTAHNRGRTLLMAHQTAAVVQTTIEQSLSLCSNNVQQIDHLLSVTIPQWAAAFKS